MDAPSNNSSKGAPEKPPSDSPVCGGLFDNGCRQNENEWNSHMGLGGNGRLWRDVNISFVVAASYLAMIALIAVVMYVRNRTRLRLIVVIFSVINLSSAVAGFLSTSRFRGSYKTDVNDSLPTNIFWSWYFAAEGVGTAILAWTIVKQGTVFYSQAGRKNIFYVLSIVMISVFATFATANLVVYITQVNGKAIRGTLADHYEICVNFMLYCKSSDISKTGRKTGGSFEWMERIMDRWRDSQKNPSREVYLPNQVLTAVTYLWVSLYLFVPLLRNRKHRPVIGSDMTAVGIWYLSCLTILVSVSVQCKKSKQAGHLPTGMLTTVLNYTSIFLGIYCTHLLVLLSNNF
jgi:hypothetical protein